MKPLPDTKTTAKVGEPEQSVGAKLAVELGPLLIFFGVNAIYGIFAGTAAFMAATVVSLGYAWLRHRKVPVMLVVSAVIVLAFGGLTLYLQDETFIKLKPTIVYTMFAVLLAAGLLTRKPVLELLFGPVFSLTEEGWRKLTLRWAVFFVAMAVLNEIVWRNFSTDTWVSFKAFGFLPITFLFAMAQVPLMQRYGVPADEAPK
ncbi:MAG: septation protein A [Methyloceanibacter sp.]|uniref:septation protein A n=1 Tax=Methyloceanibacter sp. TaxID=1965321 RepID=UPI003D6D62E1